MASNKLYTDSIFACQGMVVAITGGGTGIGAVMARAFVQNGAIVYILGRRRGKLDEVVASLQASGEDRIHAIECDTTSPTSLQAAASRISRTSGFVNLLIANAGVGGPSDRALLPRAADDPRGTLTLKEVQEHLTSRPVEDVVDVYRTNVAGVWYSIASFLDLLDQGNHKGNVQQTSQVLVTSSIGAFHRDWPLASLSYTVSKAAVNHLVKSLAAFLIRWKIRVNAVAPGMFMSEMMQSVLGDNDFTVEGAMPAELQPMRRCGRDEEIAGTVIYFASTAGAYCNGSIHVVDGGRLGILPGTTY